MFEEVAKCELGGVLANVMRPFVERVVGPVGDDARVRCERREAIVVVAAAPEDRLEQQTERTVGPRASTRVVQMEELMKERLVDVARIAVERPVEVVADATLRGVRRWTGRRFERRRTPADAGRTPRAGRRETRRTRRTRRTPGGSSEAIRDGAGALRWEAPGRAPRSRLPGSPRSSRSCRHRRGCSWWRRAHARARRRRDRRRNGVGEDTPHVREDRGRCGMPARQGESPTSAQRSERARWFSTLRFAKAFAGSGIAPRQPIARRTKGREQRANQAALVVAGVPVVDGSCGGVVSPPRWMQSAAVDAKATRAIFISPPCPRLQS